MWIVELGITAIPRSSCYFNNTKERCTVPPTNIFTRLKEKRNSVNSKTAKKKEKKYQTEGSKSVYKKYGILGYEDKKKI